MAYSINQNHITLARNFFINRSQIYWIVGGAGSGKSTISNALSTQLNIPHYDMDAYIYGDYHSRFTNEKHPVNKEWSTAENSLAWLLEKPWEEFNNFHRAALAEYLELLIEDLSDTLKDRLIIDGGIINPALLAKALPPQQIVALTTPWQSSIEVWDSTEERRRMKTFIENLADQDNNWKTFLDLDANITRNISDECTFSGISIYARSKDETVPEVVQQVINILQMKD